MCAAGDPVGALLSNTPSSRPAPEAQTKPLVAHITRQRGQGPTWSQSSQGNDRTPPSP